MQRSIRAATLAALVMIALIACGEDPTDSAEAVPSAQTNSVDGFIRIEVTPTFSTIVVSLTQQFTATGTFDDGSTQDLTNQVSWSSTDPEVAAVDSDGLVTGINAGTVFISAELTFFLTEVILTVRDPTLVSLAITPEGGITDIIIGDRIQLRAVGTFSKVSSQDLSDSVIWTSTNNLAAEVDEGGIVLGLSSGSAIIAATHQSTGIQALYALTVSAPNLIGINITPSVTQVVIGQSVQFVARGTFDNGTIADITSEVAWSSADPFIAGVNSTGLATGIAEGFATIIARDLATGFEDFAALSVVGADLLAITVTPGLAEIETGTTLQFSALGLFNDLTSRDITDEVTWTTSDTSVATVGGQGLATAIGLGTTNITATMTNNAGEDVAGTAVLTVAGVSLTEIIVTPVDPSTAAGSVLQFTATGTFSDFSTQDLTAQVTWSSDAVTVATITNAPGSAGVASAVATGIAVITAINASPFISGSTTLTVTSGSPVPFEPTRK